MATVDAIETSGADRSPFLGRHRVAPWVGLGIALLLIVAAIAIPALTGWDVWAKWFPPLHARWRPRVGPGTVPAVVMAIGAGAFGVRWAGTARWGRLLLVSFGAATAWLAALALVDGPAGLGAILDSPTEYLRTARAITDLGAFLHEYIARIPADAPHHWLTHIAGHPPGAVLFFAALASMGLGSWQAAGPIVLLLAATTPLAVLITLRRLGAEQAARRAAPFLVMGPAAIWMAVSADAMFGAVAAWGLCCLAVAATSTGRRAVAGCSIAAGLLLGYCVMLSYGLPLLAVLACAVLLAARSWRPLLWTAGSAVAVVAAFAVGGFAWWQAYPVLAERYWAGIASRRPASYWIWGDLAALAVSAGPLVGAGLGMVVVRLRGLRTAPPWVRVSVLLAAAALVSVLLADASQMSRAEVERIWLPFVPWLLVGTALLPERWRRIGFAGQLVFALVVQHLLFTNW